MTIPLWLFIAWIIYTGFLTLTCGIIVLALAAGLGLGPR